MTIKPIPDSVTIDNFTGKLTINKELSDDPEQAMSIRGIPWAIRKAVKIAPAMTITIVYDAAADTITINMPGIGPMKADTQVHKLDGQFVERSTPLGNIKTAVRKIQIADVQDSKLKEGWEGPNVFETTEVTDDWEATNVEGIVLLDGQRVSVRKTKIKNKKGEECYNQTFQDYAPL